MALVLAKNDISLPLLEIARVSGVYFERTWNHDPVRPS